MIFLRRWWNIMLFLSVIFSFPTFCTFLKITKHYYRCFMFLTLKKKVSKMFVLPAQSPKWRPIKQSKDRVTQAPIMALLVCVKVVVEVFVKLLRSLFTLLVGSKNNVCRCFFTSCLNKCPYQGHQLTITSKTLKQKLLKLNLYYLKSVIIFSLSFQNNNAVHAKYKFWQTGCWCIRLLSLLFFRDSL